MAGVWADKKLPGGAERDKKGPDGVSEVDVRVDLFPGPGAPVSEQLQALTDWTEANEAAGSSAALRDYMREGARSAQTPDADVLDTMHRLYVENPAEDYSYRLDESAATFVAADQASRNANEAKDGFQSLLYRAEALALLVAGAYQYVTSRCYASDPDALSDARSEPRSPHPGALLARLD